MFQQHSYTVDQRCPHVADKSKHATSQHASQARLLDMKADSCISLCRRAIFAPWPSMVTRALWASFLTRTAQGTLTSRSMVKCTGSATAAKVAAALAPVLDLLRLARTGQSLPPVRPFCCFLVSLPRYMQHAARWSSQAQVHLLLLTLASALRKHTGNSCRSDNDKDYVTYKVDCYF